MSTRIRLVNSFCSLLSTALGFMSHDRLFLHRGQGVWELSVPNWVVERLATAVSQGLPRQEGTSQCNRTAKGKTILHSINLCNDDHIAWNETTSDNKPACWLERPALTVGLHSWVNLRWKSCI